jgi:DNA-binding response OmpR family regulator
MINHPSPCLLRPLGRRKKKMSYSVLIVDDDAQIRTLLSTMLSVVGYESETAVDGIDAWEKIKHRQPDILLLDVMMPNLDGLSICKKLRSEAETAELPIIILSGKAHEEAIQEGLLAGADSYLTKPTSLADLAQNLEEILNRRGKKQGPEA